MAENLEINIVPPAAPGAPSTINLTGPQGLSIHLPLSVAAFMGSTLMQVAAVAAERDRTGSHVAPAPTTPLVMV